MTICRLFSIFLRFSIYKQNKMKNKIQKRVFDKHRLSAYYRKKVYIYLSLPPFSVTSWQLVSSRPWITWMSWNSDSVSGGFKRGRAFFKIIAAAAPLCSPLPISELQSKTKPFDLSQNVSRLFSVYLFLPLKKKKKKVPVYKYMCWFVDSL